MTAIIKNKFRLKSAKSFVENFEVPQNSDEIRDVLNDTNLTGTQRQIFQDILFKLPDRNHYLFIGKPFAWDTENTNTNSYDELNPPLPEDTQDTDARVWDEMLGLKKIIRGDVSLVIPRSDWRPSTIFAQFDSNDPDLYRQPTLGRIQQAPAGIRAGNFYALNHMFELFICVSNNNSVSVNEPRKPPTTGPNSSVNGRWEGPDDGYIWQYITTINSGDAVKFLTDKWIPIKTLPQDSAVGSPQLDVQQNAIPGELLRVDVESTSNVGSFTHTFTGKIIKRTSDTAIFGPNSPLPANTPGAYVGYELLVTVPPTTGTDPLVKRYVITDYVTSPTQILTIDDSLNDFDDLTANTEYVCRIVPLILIHSDGTGIEVEPVVDNITKRLIAVNIVNAGTNSSTVKMQVNSPANFVGDLPTLSAALSPRSGLGRDPESDLGAFYVMLSTQLRYDEEGGDFPTLNDYRQLGIIRDVKKINDEDEVILATESTLNATKIVNVQFESNSKLGIGFQSDQVVNIYKSVDPVNPVGQARVLQFIQDTNETPLISGKLQILQTTETNYYTIQEGDVIKATGVEGVVYKPTPTTPAVINEEFLKFYGDILYLENRRPILRASDQIEDIKTIIEF